MSTQILYKFPRYDNTLSNDIQNRPRRVSLPRSWTEKIQLIVIYYSLIFLPCSLHNIFALLAFIALMIQPFLSRRVPAWFNFSTWYRWLNLFVFRIISLLASGNDFLRTNWLLFMQKFISEVQLHCYEYDQFNRKELLNIH